MSGHEIQTFRASAVVEAVRRRSRADIGSTTRNELFEAVADQLIVPLYRRYRMIAIKELVEARQNLPYLAALLEYLCGRVNIDLLSIFSADEIVGTALDYMTEGMSFENGWAWSALWFGCLSDRDRWRLVMELIERVPFDDEMLWLIGDGTLSELQIQRGEASESKSWPPNSKLARILQLVDEVP